MPTAKPPTMLSAYTIGATNLRLRTLDEMSLPSTSIRRPGPPSEKGELSRRESTTLFHDLNETTRDYISGTGGPQALKRQDGQPGTKLRTQLGHNAFSKTIHSSPHFAPQGNHLEPDKKHGGEKDSPFTVFEGK